MPIAAGKIRPAKAGKTRRSIHRMSTAPCAASRRAIESKTPDERDAA